MRIVFMGTPDFALFSLRALVEAGRDPIVAVVTQPDTPKGRGYVMTPPPVKVYAEEHGIPVLQPATLRGDAFAEDLRNLAPDLIVVAAYGKILPKNVLDFPEYGCINVHGSLLPKYRGAAPMQRAIMDGERMTGVTIMYMAEGLDTGDMLMKTEVPIEDDDNFETVHDKLGAAGALALLDTIEDLKNGTATRTPQDDSLSTYAKKITKEDCLIDFGKPAEAVYDLIRGLSPVPLAFTHTGDGKLLKILSARPVVLEGDAAYAKPGEVVSLSDGHVTVACGIVPCGNETCDNTGCPNHAPRMGIAFLRVLPEGKGRMSAADFINGRKVKVGEILS